MAQAQAKQEKAALFHKSLGGIRQQFRANLMHHILVLENTAQVIRTGAAETEDFRRIAACCHKIAGTAPTLGFTEIGAQARSIENQLDCASDLQKANQVWQAIDPQFEEFLDLLEEELDPDEA